MQKHRIFVAIRLPEDIKKELLKYRHKWPELPARWTVENNLHITLKFLGYVAEEELLDVLNETEEFALKTPCFDIKLDKIRYFPDGKNPKYVFATGLPVGKQSGKYHVTLARIRMWDLKKMDPEDIPQIEENINLQFEVKSVEVMESVLKRGGAEYTILQSFDLNSEK
jgi:RNA 2',3'-cyclic 3'-phosphodiesterase